MKIQVGFGSIALTIGLAVLKSMGYISWSWWWITCPLWIPFALILAIITIWLFIGFAIALMGTIL